MTTKEKITTYISSRPSFATTHAELAERVGVSYAGVAVALPHLLAAGKLRIVGKEGRRTVYEVVGCEAGGGQ
jgi:hypothetical protein